MENEEHTDSVKTTRTTRLVYVEEISDTERRNSTYKSYESETNVEEITKSTSVVVRGKSAGKAGNPNSKGRLGSKGLMSVTPPDVKKKISEMASRKKTSKNIVTPAEIISPKNIETEDDKGDSTVNAEEEILNQINDEKSAKTPTGSVDGAASNEERSPQTGSPTIITETVVSVISEQNGEDSENRETPQEVEPTEIIPEADGDVPVANGDVVVQAVEEDGVTTDANKAEVSLENETIIKEVTEVFISGQKTGENENSSAGTAVGSEAKMSSVSSVNPMPIKTRDVEKGVVKDAEEIASLAEMKTFRRAVKKFGGADPSGPGKGGPPSRRSGRKNILQSMRSKRQFDNIEDEKGIDESLLYETLKPLLFLMKITGIFFIRKKGQFGKTFKERWRSTTPLQLYCISMCMLLFLNFFRSMFAFNSTDGFSNTLFLKFLTAIFMYESSSRAALAYWHSHRKKKGLQEFFLVVEQICYSDHIIPYETNLKRVMSGSIVVSIVVSLSYMASTAYGMFGTASDEFDSYLVPVPPDAPGVEAMKLIVLILVLINGLVAMFSLSLFTTICYVLYKEFEYFCRTFVLKIKDDGTFTDELEKFRITHQKRCKLVKDADSMFKYYIANTYMTNVPLLCMLLYVIVYAEGSDVSYRLINIYRIFYVLVQMAVVSTAATMINNQAHAPLGDVYSIRVLSATTQRELEVNMFLNKLTGTQIGMTAWDMFVINKPTVLTVVGMVLTYFFLLVQFKSPLGEPTPCRCMVNVSSDILRSLVTEVITEAMVTSEMMFSNDTMFTHNETMFTTDTMMHDTT